jgi:hypothetical protein
MTGEAQPAAAVEQATENVKSPKRDAPNVQFDSPEARRVESVNGCLRDSKLSAQAALTSSIGIWMVL